ncbi:hypothetical protein BDQ17DRAFT_1335597 [Cyathus striatus]|nr:hypothetical protein BDQ17DRAFT_1335597 [Cyathus striatus]
MDVVNYVLELFRSVSSCHASSPASTSPPPASSASTIKKPGFIAALDKRVKEKLMLGGRKNDWWRGFQGKLESFQTAAQQSHVPALLTNAPASTSTSSVFGGAKPSSFGLGSAFGSGSRSAFGGFKAGNTFNGSTFGGTGTGTGSALGGSSTFGESTFGGTSTISCGRGGETWESVGGSLCIRVRVDDVLASEMRSVRPQYGGKGKRTKEDGT